MLWVGMIIDNCMIDHVHSVPHVLRDCPNSKQLLLVCCGQLTSCVHTYTLSTCSTAHTAQLVCVYIVCTMSLTLFYCSHLHALEMHPLPSILSGYIYNPHILSSSGSEFTACCHILWKPAICNKLCQICPTCLKPA